MDIRDRTITIGITGGIAAYKVCEVISTLAKAGGQVRVVLTEGAQKFITPLTVSTLSRHCAYTDADFWSADRPRPLHIELGETAEVFLIAPLTANTLGKLAWGLADNLLTNTVLASNCPILLAPAMNTDMWQQATVQRNWQQVCQDPRYRILEPGAGILACDRVGTGRMAEPADILAEIESLLYCGGKRDLVNKRILVSAGGTREYIDPVRFLGNPATGKMGIAIARAAATRGGQVTLVSATEVTLSGVQTIVTPTADRMRSSLLSHFPDADWTIMAAAVGDVRPAEYSSDKIPKRSLPSALPLEPVPDILAELGTRKQPHQRLVGFAAQTGDIEAPALAKLQGKNLDAIVANPVDRPEAGFGSDTNRAVFLSAGRDRSELSPRRKLRLAHDLLDLIATNFN